MSEITLDTIINRAIPIEPGDCRIKTAKKEALRLKTKQDLLILISKNFTPKPKEKADPLT